MAAVSALFTGVVLDAFRVRGRALKFQEVADAVAAEWGGVTVVQNGAWERRVHRALAALLRRRALVARGSKGGPNRRYMMPAVAPRFDRANGYTDMEIVHALAALPLRHAGAFRHIPVSRSFGA